VLNTEDEIGSVAYKGFKIYYEFTGEDYGNEGHLEAGIKCEAVRAGTNAIVIHMRMK